MANMPSDTEYVAKILSALSELSKDAQLTVLIDIIKQCPDSRILALQRLRQEYYGPIDVKAWARSALLILDQREEDRYRRVPDEEKGLTGDVVSDITALIKKAVALRNPKNVCVALTTILDQIDYDSHCHKKTSFKYYVGDTVDDIIKGITKAVKKLSDTDDMEHVLNKLKGCESRLEPYGIENIGKATAAVEAFIVKTATADSKRKADDQPWGTDAAAAAAGAAAAGAKKQRTEQIDLCDDSSSSENDDDDDDDEEEEED